LLLAWPQPFETVVLVSGPERQLSLTVDTLTEVERTRPRGNGYVLTGDAGLAHVLATVTYHLSEPRTWVVERAGAEPALRRMVADALIDACARRRLDGVLVASLDATAAGDDDAAASRERLRQDLSDALTQHLRTMRLGVSVNRVDLTVTLPQIARSAFAGVAGAEAEAASLIAAARTEAERGVQAARSGADQRIADAEARARELQTRATIATATVRSLIVTQDPAERSLLLTRLWRERLEAIVRKAGGVVAIAPDGPAMALPVRLP
jgi:regulator of protease activity HflC (stomatin/prohibitin superfamily)